MFKDEILQAVHGGERLTLVVERRLIEAAIDFCRGRLAEPTELIENVELVKTSLKRHDAAMVSRSLHR